MKSKIISNKNIGATQDFTKAGIFKLKGHDVFVLSQPESKASKDPCVFSGVVIYTHLLGYWIIGKVYSQLDKNDWVKINEPVAIEFYD